MPQIIGGQGGNAAKVNPNGSLDVNVVGGATGGGTATGGGASTVTKSLRETRWTGFDTLRWDVSTAGGATYTIIPDSRLEVSMPVDPEASFTMLSREVFTGFVSLKIHSLFGLPSDRIAIYEFVSVDSSGVPDDTWRFGWTEDPEASDVYASRFYNNRGQGITPTPVTDSSWNQNYYVEYAGGAMVWTASTGGYARSDYPAPPPDDIRYKVRITFTNSLVSPPTSTMGYGLFFLEAEEFTAPPKELQSIETLVTQGTSNHSDPWPMHIANGAPWGFLKINPDGSLDVNVVPIPYTDILVYEGSVTFPPDPPVPTVLTVNLPFPTVITEQTKYIAVVSNPGPTSLLIEPNYKETIDGTVLWATPYDGANASPGQTQHVVFPVWPAEGLRLAISGGGPSPEAVTCLIRVKQVS